MLWAYLSRQALESSLSTAQLLPIIRWLGHLWGQMNLAWTQRSQGPPEVSALRTATHAVGAAKQIC